MTKNRYPKYLGIVFAVVVFAFVVSVIYYWQARHLPAPAPFTNPRNRSFSIFDKKEYENDAYKFLFKYVGRYQLDTSGSQQNYFESMGKTVADVSIPAAKYPKTNFGSAHIAFAVKENSTRTDCKTYVTSADETKQMKDSAKLNGDIFYMAGTDGAAAGTVYKTNIYRILQGDTCYEANLTVGIANIGNFEPGVVSEVVEADVWNELSAIFVSLKFKD